MRPEHLLDLALVGTILVTAYRALYARELFTAVVFYIIFGVLLALVWVRLEAPDLALVEAAIGAGITGAMLLDAAHQVGSAGPVRATDHRSSWIAAAAAGAFAVGLTFPLRSFLGDAGGLGGMVRASLAESGVDHPITAVLLNFRGYDTWLEVGVLVVATLGIFVLRRTSDFAPAEADLAPPAIARGGAALVVPFGLLVAGYLLWRGSHAPGGAFQAGAVVGALGVLLSLSGQNPLAHVRPLTLRLLLICGFGTFLLVGLLSILSGGSFLEFPPDRAGLMIVVIEAAAAVSTATILLLLFTGGRSGREVRDAERARVL